MTEDFSPLPQEEFSALLDEWPELFKVEGEMVAQSKEWIEWFTENEEMIRDIFAVIVSLARESKKTWRDVFLEADIEIISKYLNRDIDIVTLTYLACAKCAFRHRQQIENNVDVSFYDVVVR